MDDELKYRKHGNKTQKELAEELHVPKEIVTALELGSHKHPSPARKKDPQPDRTMRSRGSEGSHIHRSWSPYKRGTRS